MIFRVVIRCKSNDDRSSGNNNCKKVGNVIKPWMLSTQESFQETPHILDRFLNLLPNTAYTHIPQNTRRIEISIKNQEASLRWISLENKFFLVGDEHDLAVGDALEMLAVRALAVTLRGLHELVARDPTVLEGDLLHNRNRQTLQQ